MYNNNNFQKTTGRSRDVPLVVLKDAVKRNVNILKFILQAKQILFIHNNLTVKIYY